MQKSKIFRIRIFYSGSVLILDLLELWISDEPKNKLHDSRSYLDGALCSLSLAMWK